MFEPVGDKLSEVLTECDINVDKGCACMDWISRMNSWGLAGCKRKRQQIIEHLREMSRRETSLWDKLKVAAKGYFTTGMLLDEAIKRCTPSSDIPK